MVTCIFVGVQELLSSSGIAQRVEETKAAKEVAALNMFFAVFAHDSSRAFYGPGHVVAAAEQCAVATLLISDSLYRYAHAEPVRMRLCCTVCLADWLSSEYNRKYVGL
jgi:protein pelota